jgi:alkanesulfonate monooxygenase SsuD/methylene tetrahydromethanopterin reductase-like flavin-dependent oxidoreductase (luciferase family)
MHLAVNLGTTAGNDTSWVELAVTAERLGYDSVWVAEAHSSDAVSVLAWVGARTERVGLGAAVLQIPGRTPAMTAMTAASLDTLSGGRFRLGLGVSGPQVSEGWHGIPFDRPLERTREYVDVVRLALARKEVSYQGSHWRLPLTGGQGKVLRLGAADVGVTTLAVAPFPDNPAARVETLRATVTAIERAGLV